MAIRPPEVMVEVVYRRTSGGGKESETYTVHCEKLMVGDEEAYQSISVYQDRVRRMTMRARDLTPIAMTEKWFAGDKLVERTYFANKARAVRRNLPYPIDETVEVPPGVHDPESFAFLLKGYPFDKQDSVSPINVLLAEPNPILKRPVTLSVLIVPHGEETVKVPAGEFRCYKMSMGLAGVLGYVVPDNVLWLLKDDPHLLVKAEGAGEMFELVRGGVACDPDDRTKHCKVAAEAPKVGK